MLRKFSGKALISNFPIRYSGKHKATRPPTERKPHRVSYSLRAPPFCWFCRDAKTRPPPPCWGLNPTKRPATQAMFSSPLLSQPFWTLEPASGFSAAHCSVRRFTCSRILRTLSCSLAEGARRLGSDAGSSAVRRGLAHLPSSWDGTPPKKKRKEESS